MVGNQHTTIFSLGFVVDAVGVSFPCVLHALSSTVPVGIISIIDPEFMPRITTFEHNITCTKRQSDELVFDDIALGFARLYSE